MSLLRKLFSPKKEKASPNKCEMEKCVYCGAVTSVPVSMPIESRPNFISGCGQLCPECYAKLCSSSLDDEDSRLVSAVFEKNGENAQ